MNVGLLLTLLVTTIVAISGWWVVHSMEMNRDYTNKRRELRVQYLIDAYRSIESCTNRPGLTKDQCHILESAMADIQLFGTVKQAKLAKDFIRDVAENQTGQADTLLEDLRDDLRKELKLESTPGDIVFLRFSRDKDDTV
jgi:hypothetical protein